MVVAVVTSHPSSWYLGSDASLAADDDDASVVVAFWVGVHCCSILNPFCSSLYFAIDDLEGQQRHGLSDQDPRCKIF